MLIDGLFFFSCDGGSPGSDSTTDEKFTFNEMTSYNTAFTDCSLAMSCTSSGWGVVLFFPRTVGEYTISNISIANN